MTSLDGLCHVPDIVCPGIELYSVACKELVQEKTCTRLTDMCKFLVQDDLHKFLIQVF